jgi:hypothetical protein
LYYDTLFADAPDLAPLFTLERERMGVKFVDMLAVCMCVCVCVCVSTFYAGEGVYGRQVCGYACGCMYVCEREWEKSLCVCVHFLR